MPKLNVEDHDWSEIAEKNDRKEALSPLETYLLEWEPAGEDDVMFRQQLQAVIDQSYADGKNDVLKSTK